MNTEILHTIDQFKSLSPLIIGDVMIDSYTKGMVQRISPEAPVPVLDVNHKENRLGGAANVALNAKSLGANPILVAISGQDANGNELLDLMLKTGLNTEGILACEDRRTTVKTRIMSQQQQMIRIDEEDTFSISSQQEEQIFKNVVSLIEKHQCEVIIFEDYEKGLLTPNLIQKIVAFANDNNIPTTVDPKKVNFFAYSNVSLFKPNLKELNEGFNTHVKGDDLPGIKEVCSSLNQKQNISTALITLSEYGVCYLDHSEFKHYKAHDRKIVDVSGAGDTVITVASLCYALNAPMSLVAQLANLAGGLVCEFAGVVPITTDLLKEKANAITIE